MTKLLATAYGLHTYPKPEIFICQPLQSVIAVGSLWRIVRQLRTDQVEIEAMPASLFPQYQAMTGVEIDKAHALRGSVRYTVPLLAIDTVEVKALINPTAFVIVDGWHRFYRASQVKPAIAIEVIRLPLSVWQRYSVPIPVAAELGWIAANEAATQLGYGYPIDNPLWEMGVHVNDPLEIYYKQNARA